MRGAATVAVFSQVPYFDRPELADFGERQLLILAQTSCRIARANAAIHIEFVRRSTMGLSVKSSACYGIPQHSIISIRIVGDTQTFLKTCCCKLAAQRRTLGNCPLVSIRHSVEPATRLNAGNHLNLAFP